MMTTLNDLTAEEQAMYHEAVGAREDFLIEAQKVFDFMEENKDYDIPNDGFYKALEILSENPELPEILGWEFGWKFDSQLEYEEHLDDVLSEYIYDTIYEMDNMALDIFMPDPTFVEFSIPWLKGVDDVFTLLGTITRYTNYTFTETYLERSYIEFHEEQAHETTMNGMFEEHHEQIMNTYEEIFDEAHDALLSVVTDIEYGREVIDDIFNPERLASDFIRFVRM